MDAQIGAVVAVKLAPIVAAKSHQLTHVRYHWRAQGTWSTMVQSDHRSKHGSLHNTAMQSMCRHACRRSKVKFLEFWRRVARFCLVGATLCIDSRENLGNRFTRYGGVIGVFVGLARHGKNARTRSK